MVVVLLFNSCATRSGKGEIFLENIVEVKFLDMGTGIAPDSIRARHIYQ